MQQNTMKTPGIWRNSFAAFEKFCNPFEECGEELINIFTRQVFSDESVSHAEEIGREKT